MARAASLALARRLLKAVPEQHAPAARADPATGTAPSCFVCRRCGGPLLIVEIFVRGQTANHQRLRSRRHCLIDVTDRCSGGAHIVYSSAGAQSP